MTHVTTLISNPAALALDDAALSRILPELPGAQAPSWLAPEIAADIHFTPARGQDLAALERSLREALPGVDVVIQPAANRRKRLLIADMDSTMIGQECLDELAGELGLKEHVSEITERAMRGEIAFEPALRERVALLKGLAASAIGNVLDNRITLTPGARELVGTMRASGAYTALVSGGFTLFTGPVAAMIGFHEHRSNILEEEDGKLLGTVREPILGREAKLARLRELRAEHGLAMSETLAVGDGANDLAMLGEAGLGVAYRAKPAVAAAAHARINHGDLTALLYLQGYRRADFTTV